jgi:hypothetical protein
MKVMNKEKAIKLIKERIKEIKTLKDKPRYKKDYHLWKNKTENTIKNIFGKDSEYLKKFEDVWTGGFVTDDASAQKMFIESLDEAESLLQATIDEIKTFGIKQDLQKNKITEKIYPNEVQIAIVVFLIGFYVALPTILPEELGGFTFTLPRIASYSLAGLWFVTVIIGAFVSDVLLTTSKVKKIYQIWFSICNIATLGWFVFLLTAYLSYILNNNLIFFVIIIILIFLNFKRKILKS